MRGASRLYCRVARPTWILATAGLLLQLTSLAPLVALADSGITVIPLKHRLPDELIVALTPHLQPGESVSGHHTQLILQALPRRQPQLLELIHQMDTARRNLRIRIRHNKDQELLQQQQSVDGAWQQGQTRVVISSGSRTDPEGIAARPDGTRNHVAFRSGRTITSNRNESDMSLLVLDGTHATLRVGKSITQVQPWLELAGHRLTALAAVHVYDVTTGFDVQPRLLGDRIHLTLNPRLAFRTDRGDRIVQFLDLRTEIIVTPGEWVDLGGMVEQISNVHRQILASRRQHSAEDNRLMIRIDPL